MVAATSQTTLGLTIWTGGLATAGWIARRIDGWWKNRKLSPSEALAVAFENGLSDALIEGLAIVLIAIIAWIGFIPVVVYRDHQYLVGASQRIQKRLDSKNGESGLRLNIDEMSSSRSKDRISMIVVAAVSNVGEPSVADQWLLEMIPRSGKSITILPSTINQDKPLEFHYDSGRTIAWNPKDALYLKTSSIPVPNGGKQTGFLIFTLPPSITQPQAEIPETIYRLSCMDVFGRKISTDYHMTGGRWQEMPYFPGLDQPSVRNPK
jgi:hypothetical protein